MSITLASSYTRSIEQRILAEIVGGLSEWDTAMFPVDGEIEAVCMEADEKFREKWDATMKPATWAGETEAPDMVRFFRDTVVTFESSHDTGGVNIYGHIQWSYGDIVVEDGYQYPDGYAVHPDDLDAEYEAWAEGQGEADVEAARQTVRDGRELVEEISDWICAQVEDAIKAKASELAESANLLAEWNSTEETDARFSYDEYEGWSYNGDTTGYDAVLVLDRDFQRTVQGSYEHHRVREVALEAWGVKNG